MSRLQLAGALALVVLSTGLLASRCALDPAVPFLVEDESAPWIGYPLPPVGVSTVARRDALPVTVFTRRIVAPAAGEARLRLRALRHWEAYLNGERLGSSPEGGHWREYQTLPLHLRAGANELRVEVVNPTGPGLLSLAVEGLPEPLVSDERFRVTSRGFPRRAAVPIRGDAINPSTFAMPTPGEGFAARPATPLAGFALGVLLFLGLRSLRSRRLGAAAWAWLPALVAVPWLGFLATALEIPLDVGFDARHHVAYVEYLLEHRALPLASDGWSMFHPPLYYVPTALLVALQRTLAPAADTLLAWKLVGWAAGLGTALLCAALARRLFGASREAALAAGFAALLPMNVYISSYVTNESLTATACTAVVLATVALLLARGTRPRDVALWAGLVALAVLAKYTAWIVAAVAGFFLLVKWLRVEAAPPAALARRVAGASAVVLALAGWFYLRNLLHFGSPFPLNTDLPGATQAWWQQPGYYTPAFFLHIGSVLAHPFLAGFHGAWDSFYSTLWGDGQLAGQALANRRHPYWDWNRMAVGYLLALPASLALLAGAARSLRTALLDADAHRRAAHSFLLTLAWVLLLAVLFMTLRQPDYGPAKAFYALAGIGPLAVFFGLGCGAADRWLEARGITWARALVWGWLGATAVTFALSYA